MSASQLNMKIIEELLQLHWQWMKVEDMNMYLSEYISVDHIEWILLYYNICPIKLSRITISDCLNKHWFYWMDIKELRRLLLRSTLSEIYYWEYISDWLFKPKQFYDLSNVRSYRDILYNDNSFI